MSNTETLCSRCSWRDTENSTFAPVPYGRSVLDITFGYGARVEPCQYSVSESGLVVCRAVRGIPGGTYAQQLGIEPLIGAELFLRPGKVVQRHKVSYAADGCHPSADPEGSASCQPSASNSLRQPIECVLLP